ncbi:MAG: fibronectin type III domain-containing protein [Candidatus Saccharimonadales bacterium]
MTAVFVLASFQASAQTKTLGASDILEGTMQYGTTQLTNQNTRLSLQQGVVGSWDSSTIDGIQPLETVSRGTPSFARGPNDTIYHIQSSDGQCFFRSYDTQLQKWNILKSVPVGCGSGTKIVGDGTKYIYYLPGGSTSLLYRYDIGSDTWQKLSDTLSQVSGYVDASYVVRNNQGYIYLFRGASSASFLQYSVTTDQWNTMAPFPTSSNVNTGIAMAWDEADSIYAISNDIGEFKKYSITTNTWTSLTQVDMSYNNRQTLNYVSGKIIATQLKMHGSRDRAILKSYTIATNTWSTLASPPVGSTVYDFSPASTYDGSRYLYAQYGTEIYQDIYRYDTQANTWNAASLFTNIETDNTDWHHDVIYDGAQTVYYTGGDGGDSVDRVYKYDLVTKQATQIGNQINTKSGWTGVYKSGSLYMLPYENNNIFQKYDVATNSWTQLSDLPYATSGWGGESIVDGNDGYLYISFGNRREYFRYHIATNTWQSLSSIPLKVSSGGGLTRIGTTIYASTGGGTGSLYRYSITNNTWSQVSNYIPNGKIDQGGYITSDGSRYLYIGTGTRTDPQNRRLFRFDTTNDTWQRLADTPAPTNVGASAFYDTTNSKLYVSQSMTSGRLWSWTPNGANYVPSGNWYSKSISLTQVQSWQSLQSTIGGTGTATIYTRTSPNGRIWTDWQAVVGTSIQSPVNSYIQLKVTLNGNGSTTPTISDFNIQYTQESDVPTLPSQMIVFANKGSTAQLTSGQTYEHQHPYFTWQGATDGANGSGIDGYYVYFGTNSSADPAIDGNYQHGADYVATTPMTAGEVYYLRIKTKDKLGYVSSTATYFSYRYWYISPPGTQIMTSDQDFNTGVNTKVSISGNSMQLRKLDNGSWATGAVDALPDTPYGSSEVIVDNYLYMMRGNNTDTMWRYDVVNRVWQTMANAPGVVTAGSSMTYDGSRYIYIIAGGNTNNFYRYDTMNDSWQTRGTLPSGAQIGSDISYIGNGKIIMMLTGGREFYIYDIATSIFETRQSYPSSVTYGGSGIWYDGDDSVYVNMGSASIWDFYDNNRTNFTKYSISNDTWRSLASPPVSTIYNQNNLVGDGHGGLYVFTSNEYTYLGDKQRAYRYDIASDEWSEAPGLTSQSIYGSAVSDNNRYVYIVPSNAGTSRQLVRYDTWNKNYTPATKNIDKWERVLWDYPSNSWRWKQGNSTTATYDGSKYIYAIGADEGYSSYFVRYDPATGNTKYLPPPYYASIGGSLAYIDGYVYYIRSGNSRELLRYDIASEQWVRMADLPGNAYRPGSSTLQTVGSSLYALRGNNSGLYRYTPDSGGGSWSTMASAPGTILNGSAVYDSQNGYIYVIAGGDTANFYRYSVGSNTWSTMSSLPVSSAYGSALTMNNGKIYASAGSWSKSMYVYDVSANSWSQGADTPEPFRYGATLIKLNNNKALVFAGDDSPDIWQFNFPGTNTAYEGSATHTSQTFTIPGIYDYAGITSQVDMPEGTSIEFFTRTSDNGTDWNEWSRADEVKQYSGQMTVKVTSTPRLYTQIKVVLESNDNLYTPTVSSYALNYYYDVDAPTNPSVLEVRQSTVDSTVLTSNIWYNHPAPVFDWPDPGQPGGATDGPIGSNLAGYWVYLGTDATASPRTAGQFVTDTSFVPNLQSSGTYYLRIQSQDVTGNVDGNIFAPFIYKFDKDPPTAPNLITVTPGGYTTTNNFTFDWSAAFDAHSGILNYCYHTGATSGPFAAEACQPTRNLTDISAAYRTGTNVMYIRTIDKAGNYSPSDTTVSYYYSTDPPSPPTNLRAIPPTSPQNLFAFAWDLPSLYSGDPDQLTYCYSINELPSAINTTCTDQLFISAFKAATRQGTNIIYMVTKDEANNVNWNNYTSGNFIANTVSPGIPLNLVVTDTSDRVAGRWSLTATWDSPTFEGNGIEEYVIERSPDGHSFTEIGKTSTVAFVDLGVEPGETYYYRIRAADNVDNRGGPSGTVSGSPKGSFNTPPNIVVQPHAQAGFDQATIKWATDRSSTSFVYYGTNPSNLNQSKGTLETTTDHSITIDGLNPSATYYYRVQSFDNERTYSLADAFSQIYYVKTTETARIFDVKSSDTTLNSTVLSWQTSVPTKIRIEYGTTLSYGLSESSEDDYSTNHTFKLANLESGTTYHYRIVATTAFGSVIRSDDYTMTTIARPVVSSVRFNPIQDSPTTAVRVTWKTNVPTSSTVRYQGSGVNKEETTSAFLTEHDMILSDLASSTDYAITVEGRDQYGNPTASETQRWKSGFDTRSPDISDVNLSMTTTEGVGNTRAQLIVSWKTDEPSTSQVAYGKSKDKKLNKMTPIDTEPTTNHVVIISNLDLADIYKIQILTKDISGNQTQGSSTLVVTPDKETNVLDSVITLMQRLFRF